jgi:polyphenol oxidase
MRRHSSSSLAYYTFDALRVKHGVFTRLGGVSEGQWASLNLSRSTGDTLEAVRENRDRMMAAMDTREWLTSWLVHGNHVRVVTRADKGQDDVHADAMITREHGFALTLRFADCVPVIFHDPVRGAIGVAHAGWKGVVNGVLPATVRALTEAFGSNPADVIACVGPCIGPDKFEVGHDVAAAIQAVVPEPVVRASADGANPYVDLWRATRAQLQAAGVGLVENASMCTASDTTEWFSHRAEHGKTGRFGVLVELQK